MRVEVDRARCVHSGYCTQLAPDVFDLRADGSHVTVSQVPHDQQEAVAEAELLCPSSAIHADEPDPA